MCRSLMCNGSRHTLQFIKDKDYGDLLSAAQIAKAERVIRRLIKEHLNGKWDKR